MKKLFKILGIILIPVPLVIIYLAITGAPAPPDVEATGVGRVSWTTVYDIISFGSELPERDAFVEWFPSGDSLILKRTNQNSRRAYHTVSPTEGKVHKLESLTRKASNLTFISEQELLYNIDTDGTERHKIIRANVSGGSYDTIASNDARNLLGSYHPHKNLLAYGSNLRNGKETDLVILDMTTGNETVLKSDGRYVSGNWSRDGDRLLFWDYTSNSETKLYYYSLQRGQIST